MSIAEQYNNFQNDFGSGLDKDFDTIIDELFASDFKKIANGQELVSEAAHLHAQLISAKGMLGSFSINPVYIFQSSDGKHFTNRYIIETAKAGNFEVIAIMTIDDQKHISLIDEVYYQIQ
jgi:hypothetical protein